MNVKFYLDTQKKTKHGDRPVYMYITFDGKRIRKPVGGVHTSEKHWDDEKGRIIRSGRLDPLDEIKSYNQRLNHTH
jgi:hypothetical protein